MMKSKTPTWTHRRGAAEKALSAYQKKGAELTNAIAIGEMLKDESDRGIVVIYGSFIEDALVDRVIEKLGISSEHRAQLTKASGALHKASSVAELAVVLELITPEVADWLAVVRMMRNACAHSRQEINFATPELIQTFELLLNEDIAGNVANILDRASIRDVFIMIAGNLLSEVSGEPRVGGIPKHLQHALHVVQTIRGEPPRSPTTFTLQPGESLDLDISE